MKPGLPFIACAIPLLCLSPMDGCASGQTAPGRQYAATAIEIPRFDSTRAFAFLTLQTALGPRVPGSASHDQCIRQLIDSLRTKADTVIVQEFPHLHPRLGRLRLTNVVARFLPSLTKRLMLTAHWDSRPWADSDPSETNRSKPVPGANDGASGVAVLLELAAQFRLHPPPVGIDVVLFDEEDAGTSGDLSSWCIGSRYFASHLPNGFTCRAAVNLDMVGDRFLQIRREQRSDQLARDILDRVFAAAAETGAAAFIDEPGDSVFDDHVVLNSVGIPAVDLIDFDYTENGRSFWHTVDDLPAHCSAASLHEVGTVLLNLIYRHGPLM